MLISINSKQTQVLKLTKRSFLFFVSLLFKSVITYSQHYSFQNYTVEDGLAQSQVLSMCQYSDGRMLFGTNNGGVSVYDGVKFTSFNQNDGLINNFVYTIAELDNRKIIFGTNGGVSLLSGKKITNYTEKEGLNSNQIFKIIQDKQGNVWIGTSKGVCKLVNDKIAPFTLDSILSKSAVYTIFSDSNDNIWFGTMKNGVVKYSPKQQKIIYFNESNGLTHNFVWAINEDKVGNIFIGTNAGLCKINTDNQIEKVIISGATMQTFRAIVRDKKSNLWFITPDCFYKYDLETYKFFNLKDDFLGTIFYCAVEDLEGNLWIAVHGKGLVKFQGEQFFSFTKKDSLSGDYIYSVFQDSKKNMWFAIKGNGVYKLSENRIVAHYLANKKNPIKSLIDNEIQAITEDNNGNLYFGGLYGGLSIFNGSSFYNLDETNGLPSTNIYSIIKDHSGTIWIGTEKGLCVWKDDKIQVVEEVEKLIPENGNLPIYSIFEDSNYNMWVATENGVLMYNRKIIVKYNKNNGFTDKTVVSIVQEANGCLWFGTNEGVFRYNHNSFKKIDVANGLASNSVYFIEFDKQNNLWIGSTGGLDRLNVAAYNASGKVEIKHFDKGDGLEGKEFNANAKFKDKEGRLWFGTINGVTVYDPKYAKKNDNEAITRITGIRLFFENAEEELNKSSTSIDSITGLPVNLVLPHDKNHITFDFIGVCLTDPSKVRYQTKLEGIDKDWFPPTSKTEVTYSSLPPGKYVFHVKAMNNDGLWNKNDVVYSFEIVPPWYATWLFRTIVALLVISSVVGYFYYRTATLRERQKQLEQLVLERTSEVVLQKDEAEKQKEIADSQRIIAEELKSVAEQQRHIVEEKQKEIVDSITYAKRIQTALLTSEEYISESLPAEHFILFKPKDIVSGDFYWALKVARLPGWDMGTNKKKLPSYDSLKNIFYIITGDCTGHGVPGAFMSMLNISFLNEIIVDHGKRLPHDILNEQRKEIIQALNPIGSNEESKDGMDCVLCAYDFDKMLLHFAAANNPLWLVRNGELIEYRADKMPVGKYMDDMPPFNLHTIELQKGDIIYTSTDGYADQFGINGQKLMKKKFKQILVEIHQLPMSEQKEYLSQFFEKWKGNEEQLDDVCVIGIKIV